MAEDKMLTNAPVETDIIDTHSIFMNTGGAIRQVKVEDFKRGLTQNDSLILSELAFYIDIIQPSSFTVDKSYRVDTGGNMRMRQLWEDASKSVLMDEHGNYCVLKRSNNQYTEDGSYVLAADGTVHPDFAHADFMKIIPKTYGRIQMVGETESPTLRCWFSLVPLPGGYIIPQQVVGKFKAGLVSGKMRSLPGLIPDNNKSIYAFWGQAQARSKRHGLANADFRAYLLIHMMSKYGWRDSQNCKIDNGSIVWGVGLDGTESTNTGETTSEVGFARQKNIKTGATLLLGDTDGNSVVKDINNKDCHSVNVAGFENPWGQYWEMVQGLCSVGTDVYCWRHNFMPANNTPVASDFVNVEHVKLTRATSTPASDMNIIATQDGQGFYPIPKGHISNISYGDSYAYNSDGQLWRFGGSSNVGADCGLAAALSYSVWTGAGSSFSARLAFYGGVTEVSSQRFKELAG